MLADRGFLRRIGGAWRLERADELPLPETVQGIIAARLDALEPEDKALLQGAAVLGKVAWLGALAALGDVDASRLEQRLHSLERKEFMRRERRSAVAGERQYAFRHVLVRDVAYSQLPRAARADKHRRIAEWIETLSPDRAADRAELLAHHWLAALEFAQAAGQETMVLLDRARMAARDAGDHALDLNAFVTAARWYTAALNLWPTTDRERPRLLFRLGQARAHAEQAGAELLVEARDGFLLAGDQDAAAEAEALLGRLMWRQGQGERGAEHDRRAVALLQEAGPSRAKAAVLVNLAGNLAFAGETEEAIEVGWQGLTMANELQLDELRVRALNYLGIARIHRGDAGGITDLEAAVAIAVKGNSPLHSFAYGNLAATLIAMGDLRRGFELRVKAEKAAERFGLAGDVRHFRAERVFEDYCGGRWDAALRGADEFIAESQAGSRHYQEAGCRITRGWIRLAHGNLAGALEDADAGLTLARDTNSLEVLYPALAVRARVLLAAGRSEEGALQADELLAMLTERGVLALGLNWLGDLALVLERLERGTELEQLAATATLRTPWVQAAMAIATGEFGRAAELYAEIGSLPDESYARLRAAERLFAAGRRMEASAQAEQALAFFRQVQAGAYLDEGAALLAASA